MRASYDAQCNHHLVVAHLEPCQRKLPCVRAVKGSYFSRRRSALPPQSATVDAAALLKRLLRPLRDRIQTFELFRRPERATEEELLLG